jgi:chromosome segregation ATPase
VSHSFGLLIESVVAVLLLLTIGYCVLLNRRLKRFKADEQSLKATISELITATEIAERAIAGLKVTVRDCDQNLGERLRTAERFAADISRQVAAGESVLNRLTQIAVAARPAQDGATKTVAASAAEAPSPPDAKTMLAAAHAFAERARSRVNGLAA